MKVGGNESATKFFPSKGSSAALKLQAAREKYTSITADKYKRELERRAAEDLKQ
jgi:ADP-ribosylation factor GTPase-activating protein 2/3